MMEMGPFMSYVEGQLTKDLPLDVKILWNGFSKNHDVCSKEQKRLLQSDNTDDKLSSVLNRNSVPEPEWNNLELEIFWHVMKTYIDGLFNGESDLPEPDLNMRRLGKNNVNDFDACLQHVQTLIWSGRYSLAVSDFVAAKSYFKSSAFLRSKFSDFLNRGDIEAIRLLFMRPQPPRCRVWT